MIGLIVLAFSVVGFLSYLVVRISISCMFWISKKPNDKVYMFKTYFPYYIIVLFVLSIIAIIGLHFIAFAIFFFAGIYILALLIWNFKLNHCKRRYSTTREIIKPQNPNLP